MSRSYKKNPYSKDGSFRRGKSGKFWANKKVRNSKDSLQHGDFKKLFCSWQINDYISRYTEDELKQEWDSAENKQGYTLRDQFDTFEDALKWWRKYYKNK